MTNSIRKSVCIGSAAVALAFMLTGSVGAFSNHENKLTFNRAVALPHGIVLPAGTYSFDVASDIALDVVVVRNARKVLYMGFADRVSRPAGMSSDTSIVLGEASSNQAPPITTWYEVGSRDGHHFRY
jgi:hypothetical protein